MGGRRRLCSDEVVELLRPEENMFVMFLCTPNSYHSVPRVEGAHGGRRFIYVGISNERPSWDQSRITALD